MGSGSRKEEGTGRKGRSSSHDTIALIALPDGNVFGGCSAQRASGYKLRGRVGGTSPILGSRLCVDNDVGPRGDRHR